jgi:hypothetical protein
MRGRAQACPVVGGQASPSPPCHSEPSALWHPGPWGHRDEGPWGTTQPLLPGPGVPVRNIAAAEAPTKHNGESKFGSLRRRACCEICRRQWVWISRPPPSYQCHLLPVYLQPTRRTVSDRKILINDHRQMHHGPQEMAGKRRVPPGRSAPVH